MTMIEGFGDEVVVSFAVMLIVLIPVLILAWLSTNVSDRHLIPVIVVDSRSFQRLLQRISSITHRQLNLVTGTPAEADGARENETGAESGETTATTSEGPQGTADGSTEHTEETNAENLSTEQTADNSEQEGISGTSSLEEDNQSDPSEVPEASERNEQADTDGSVTREESYNPPESDQQLRNRRMAFFDRFQGKNESCNPEVSQGLGQSDQTGTESTPSQSESDRAQENNENQEPLEGHIRIRLKYLDERQRLVQAKPEDTILEFKRRHFASEIAENIIVRFVCNGQELKHDTHTLGSYNILDNSVIHCLLSQATQATHTPVPGRAVDFDIGTLMFPLFGLILLLIWYFRFTYRNYFNAMSTFSLIGITFLFIVALLASWRTQGLHDHND